MECDVGVCEWKRKEESGGGDWMGGEGELFSFLLEGSVALGRPCGSDTDLM